MLSLLFLLLLSGYDEILDLALLLLLTLLSEHDTVWFLLVLSLQLSAYN